jgi:hypothetical protein
MSGAVPARRPPGPPKKRQNVKARGLARFGLDLGKQVRQDLMSRVQKGDVKYARKLTHSRTVIVLDYAGGEIAFVYSSAAKEILCFLGPDAAEMKGWRNSQAAAARLFEDRPQRENGAGD